MHILILFTHSPAVGHLGYFHFLVTMNNAAMKFIHKDLCPHKSSFPLGICLGIELLGHVVALF